MRNFPVDPEALEASIDTKTPKRRAGFAGATSAVSLLIADRLLSKKPNSRLSRGFIGLGFAAGAVALGQATKAQDRERELDTLRRLNQSVRELNLGRKEGSPAIEGFVSTVETLIKENEKDIKTYGDPQDRRGYYEQTLDMVSADGAPITLIQGRTDSLRPGLFFSIKVGRNLDNVDSSGALLPPVAHEEVDHTIYFYGLTSINPRRIFTGSRRAELPLGATNTVATDAHLTAALKVLDGAQVVPLETPAE